MTDPDSELQKLIYETLILDASVSGLIGDRVYDRMPKSGSYPCVTFGPSDVTPDEVDGINSEEITIQLDVWSQDNGRLRPCKVIVGAIKNVLHNAPLSLPTPYALVEIWVEHAQVMLDPDGATAHGIMTVIAMIETH